MPDFPEVGLSVILDGVSKFNADAKSVSGTVTSLGDTVLKVGGIAAGAALGGVTALGVGFVGLAQSALEPIGAFEEMSASLSSLVAREIQEASGTEQVIKTGQAKLELTKKEQAELDKLTKGMDSEIFKRNQLSQKITLEEAALSKLQGAKKIDQSAIERKQMSLDSMRFQYEQLNKTVADHQSRITELTDKEGKYVDITKVVKTGQLDFNQALEQAGPKAKELITWVENMAIASKFSAEEVAGALQIAMSFGLATDEAKKLVSAEMNFASATGKSGEAMQRVSFALGKVNTSGKVSGEVLMQLAEAGVPAAKILQEMGYTAEDASKGLVPADKFMQAVIDDFNKFGDAAKAQANTWPGLLNSLGDLKKIALREFFTGTFEAIRPYVIDFVALLQDPGVRKWLKETGDLIGKTIANGLQSVIGYIKEAKTWLDGFLPMIKDVFAGDFASGADIEWHDYFPDWLATTIEWLYENLPLVKGALEGIAAVLAGAAVAAAIAGIGAAVLALVNPVTLLLAAGAALGVAWETNWMGMRDTLTTFWNDTAKPALSELYDWFQEQLPIAMQKLTDFWNTTLLPALSDLADWLKDNIPKAAEAVVKFWKEQLIPGVEKFSDWVNKTGIPAAKDLEKWIKTKLIPAVKDFAKWIDTKLIPALTDLKPIFDDVLQSLKDLKPALDKVGDALSGASKKMDKSGFDIRKIITDTFDYVASYIKKKLQVAQDTIGIFSDVISGDWKSAWERIQRLTTTILDTITLGITAKMREIGAGIGKSLADVVSDWGNKWDQLKTTAGQKAQAVVDTVVNYISKLPGEIAKFVGQMVTAGSNLIGGVITGIANKAGDLLNQISSTVSSSVSSLINSIKSGSIFSQLTSAGNSLISGIVSGISSAASFGNQLINKAASAISELVNSIASGGLYSTLISTGRTLVTLIGAGVTAATNFASQLIAKIAEAISGAVSAVVSGDLFNSLYDVGQGMVNGIIDGMNAQVSAIEEAFSNIITNAVNAAKARLGIACPDPSPVTAELGVGMVEGLKLGMLSKIPSLIPALEASMAGMTIAPSLIAAPALAGGGGGNSTTNIFHLGQNNISSGMDAAVFEARVLSVIRKNLR